MYQTTVRRRSLISFLDEYVIFVTPTQLQLSIFAKLLNPDKLDNLMQSSTADSLALINLLTKISNSPILLKATADKAKDDGNAVMQRAGIDEALQLLPERVQIEDFSMSGALAASIRISNTFSYPADVT